MTEQEPRIIDPRMDAIFRELFPLNLQRFSRALMMLMKQPREVTNIRVMLTHDNVHKIFRSETKRSQAIRKQWPLELRLPKLGEPDEVIDCRQFTVAWDIAIPPVKPLPTETVPVRPYVTELTPGA